MTEPDAAGAAPHDGDRDDGDRALRPGHAGASPATPAPPSDPLHAEATAVLRALVGSEDAELRADQWEAIRALVVDSRRALVVQRTGWGKSAVYFVATALLRARGAGPTVIVSPLLSLMRNQVDAARRAGIGAETINSANTTEWDDVAARVAAGTVDVLLVSPERLNNPGFREDVLPRLAATTGLLVVDEAHCISDWGHDFRPDYRRIRTLLADLPPGTPVLATTATANARVTADVAEQLAVTLHDDAPHDDAPHDGAPHDDEAEAPASHGAPHDDATLDDGAHAPGRSADPRPRPTPVPAHPAGGAPGPRAEVLVLRGGLDRPSLHLSVRRLPDHASQLAWLTSNLPRLTGSGIVYCLTVAAAEQTAEHLRAAGIDVRAYTGQTDPAERLECEADLLANRVKALVATSALGMGFDKPDLGFVVHLGAPPSPIAYYQQVGRAGRATSRADVVLLPGRDDRAVWDWFAAQAFPDERSVRQAVDALATHGGPMSTATLETRVDLRRSRLEMMLSVLDVDGAVQRVRGGWVATGLAWVYDADRYARVAATRRDEQQAIVEYVAGERCRMAFLRAALDDPELATDPGWVCGRCDVCGAGFADVVPDAAEVGAAAARQREPGVELLPRRQWPSGMAALDVPVSGRIAEDERSEAGRAVARLDGLGLGGVLRELFAHQSPAGVRDGAARGPADGATGGPTDGATGGPADGPARGPTDGATGGPADGELPVALRDPVVRLLDAWRPPVDGVVVVRSATRPRLVEHLAAGVARYLGVPVVAAVVPRPGTAPGRHDVNSAQRLAGVHRRLRLELPPDGGSAPTADGSPPPPDGSPLAGRSLLLVDDRVDSGWTVAVASRLLRRAGAEAVFPLVLGVG